MKHKTFFAGVLTIILGIGGVVIGRHIHMKSNQLLQNQSTTSKENDEDVPDHIFYGELFTVMAKLKNVHDYQDRAQLTDEQTELLRVTAEQCAEKIARQDEIAEQRMSALRQQNLKLKPTRNTPPIPAEIGELQAQRNTIVLHCRDVLRSGLGNEKFGEFRVAAKSIIKISVSRVR